MHFHFGSDHRGYAAKLELIEYVSSLGYECTDHGCFGSESCDYPDFGAAAARAVAGSGGPSTGIVICGSGVGIAIPANKVDGARCVVAWCEHVAEYGRRHNNANMLAFGGDVQTTLQMKRCLDAYLGAEFEGGRHERRVGKINALDG